MGELSEACGEELFGLLTGMLGEGAGQGGTLEVDRFGQLACVLATGGGAEAMDGGLLLAVHGLQARGEPIEALSHSLSW